MVLTHCQGQVSPDKGTKMSRKQFVEWLKHVDRNGDGRITRQELRDALRELGMSCTRWKAWRAMVHADLDRNRTIDGDLEIAELIKYAWKRWGIVVN